MFVVDFCKYASVRLCISYDVSELWFWLSSNALSSIGGAMSCIRDHVSLVLLVGRRLDLKLPEFEPRRG